MIATEWHTASYQISLLSSLALLTSALGAVVFGKIADRFGRRKVYGYEMLLLAAGLIMGPLIAIVLLATGLSHDYAWRIMLALGAVPALAVFRLRRS
jgi:MFS family permease